MPRPLSEKRSTLLVMILGPVGFFVIWSYEIPHPEIVGPHVQGEDHIGKEMERKTQPRHSITAALVGHSDVEAVG